MWRLNECSREYVSEEKPKCRKNWSLNNVRKSALLHIAVLNVCTMPGGH